MNTDKLKSLRLFLLDMDGTIYLDSELFDGSAELLEYVKSVGGRYIFLTNNSSRGCGAYIDKLAKMGIAAQPEDFFTSVDAALMFLRTREPYKKVYAFGTESFRAQLRDGGVSVTDTLEDDVDCLLMGFDTELSFKKLEDACILLGRGVDYLATNPDWVCPTWYGYVPDCGSVAEMLLRATGRRPRFIGKPEPDMALLTMQKTGFSPEQTVLIGDRVYTDIACGVNAGISTILVLSGEGTVQDAENSDTKPEFILQNVRELCDILKS